MVKFINFLFLRFITNLFLDSFLEVAEVAFCVEFVVVLAEVDNSVNGRKR